MEVKKEIQNEIKCVVLDLKEDYIEDVIPLYYHIQNNVLYHYDIELTYKEIKEILKGE